MSVSGRQVLVYAGLIAAALGCKDKTHFGPPGGLREPSAGAADCPLPDVSGIAACPEWATDIFPLFDETGPYQCATAACHGASRGGGLFIPPGDPSGAYASMAAYKRDGRPYISSSPDDGPYLLCNLHPDPAITVGAIMPPTASLRVGGSDLALIGKWVECGMLESGGTPGVGGGGAGGLGGAGGAGGI